MKALWLLLLPGCFFEVATVTSASSRGVPAATITTAAGPRAVSFDLCDSGARSYFVGVDLGSTSERALLRLLIDPIDGPRGKWMTAKNKPVVLDRSNCSVFELSVQRSGISINRIAGMMGSVKLACALPDDSTLEATLSFDGCY